MRVLVLGSGAGGGVPQWNCRCPICRVAWERPDRVRHRTETSVAVSADGVSYVILDAAPELRAQILATPALQPRGSGRQSPIAAVVLTSGEIDHVAGLLCLREGHPFAILGTGATLAHLARSPIFDALRADIVARTPIALESPMAIAGLTLTVFAVPGKAPLYAENEGVSIGDLTEDVVGIEVSDGRHRLAYVPGLAHLPATLRERLGLADLLLLDGTTFTDDELVAAGLSHKTAGRMGHLPMTGAGGSLHAFGPDTRANKLYIHLNNTNPVLVEDSAARKIVVGAGWGVAHDGMEIIL